jgi:hypothetical protein
MLDKDKVEALPQSNRWIAYKLLEPRPGNPELPRVISTEVAMKLLPQSVLRDLLDTVVRLELSVTNRFAKVINDLQLQVNAGNGVDRQTAARAVRQGYLRVVVDPSPERDDVYKYTGPIGERE